LNESKSYTAIQPRAQVQFLELFRASVENGDTFGRRCLKISADAAHISFIFIIKFVDWAELNWDNY
jgi:hypothetical protein